MTVAKLTEGVDLIQAGMTVLENIDSENQSITMTRESLENSLCCYKEVQSPVQDFFHMLKDPNGVARRTINCNSATY